MSFRVDREPPEPFGPVYPKGAPSVNKWRRLAKARPLSKEESHAYGLAVLDWIVGLSRQQLLRKGASAPAKVPCASGTWLTDGNAILAAVRAQIKAAHAALRATLAA